MVQSNFFFLQYWPHGWTHRWMGLILTDCKSPFGFQPLVVLTVLLGVVSRNKSQLQLVRVVLTVLLGVVSRNKS